MNGLIGPLAILTLLIMVLISIVSLNIGKNELIINFCSADKAISLKQQSDCISRLQEYK